MIELRFRKSGRWEAVLSRNGTRFQFVVLDDGQGVFTVEFWVNGKWIENMVAGNLQDSRMVAEYMLDHYYEDEDEEE